MSLCDIISFDVLGSEQSGWEINDATRIGSLDLTAKEYSSDERVLERLIEAGHLSHRATVDMFDFDGDEWGIEIGQADNGYPLLKIQPQDALI